MIGCAIPARLNERISLARVDVPEGGTAGQRNVVLDSCIGDAQIDEVGRVRIVPFDEYTRCRRIGDVDVPLTAELRFSRLEYIVPNNEALYTPSVVISTPSDVSVRLFCEDVDPDDFQDVWMALLALQSSLEESVVPLVDGAEPYEHAVDGIPMGVLKDALAVCE